MRLFFKFLAVFIALSLHIFSEEEIQYVKVEVAAVIWKNQITTESFEKVKEYTLANEILALEKAEEPQINQVKFDSRNSTCSLVLRAWEVLVRRYNTRARQQNSAPMPHYLGVPLPFFW